MFRKLAGLIVEMDEEPKAADPPKAAAAAPTQGAPIVTLPSAGGIDPALQETLMAKVFARRTVLSSMIESADRLKAIIPDELMRLKAAAATTGTVTSVAIKQALAVHQQDLAAEKSAFTREFDTARSTQVTSLITSADQLDSQANAARSQIEALTAQIASLTQQSVEQRSKAATVEAELATTQRTFEVTVAAVEASLTQTSEAILSALK